MENIKSITYSQSNTVSAIKPPAKKRAIVGSQKWDTNCHNITTEQELNYLGEIISENICNKGQCSLIVQNINQKITGYKYQDECKQKYDEKNFITFKYVVQLLVDSKLICYYCKKAMKLLYELVREPCQWSLDRIDNTIGHNCENLFVSCLSCNLKRKTMYHERYAFTKQLKIDKVN